MRDYLHFLYIARASLTEAQYFVHLAQRLEYLGAEEAEALDLQTRSVFGCLHGLIRAVEKEAGPVRKLVAAATSALALLLVSSPWSRIP